MHLCLMQDYIIAHNRQHVIELDANLTPLELFKVGIFARYIIYIHVDVHCISVCTY